MEQALGRASTWVFLDAFDELGPAARPETSVTVEDLPSGLAQLQGHIVVTGRPYAYTRREFFRRDDPTVVEYALQPLTRSQQQAFILEQWFRDDASRGRQVVDRIRSHPDFREMAKNPLVLTLMCLTATSETAARRPFDATSRRVHLFEWTVRDMVAGVHKGRRRQDDDPLLDHELRALERAAWIVFNTQPGDSPFTVDVWDAALRRACENPAFVRPDRVREALTEVLPQVGLLISPAHRQWMFLHRQFFEYLGAAGLAREDTAHIIEAFAAHVSDPTWREVLLFTIGMLALREPALAGEVVAQVLARAPGAAGEAVALLGEAVAEAPQDTGAAARPRTGVPADTRAELVRQLLPTMQDDRRVAPKTRAAAGTALGRIGDPLPGRQVGAAEHRSARLRGGVGRPVHHGDRSPVHHGDESRV